MCPKCKSKDVEGSPSVVVNGLVIGAQGGSVLGCALAVAAGGPAALLGLLGGAVLGGVAGVKAGEAIDPRWKYVCNRCGCTWKELE